MKIRLLNHYLAYLVIFSLFRAHFSGIGCEEAVTDWCANNPCGVGATCINAPNSDVQQVSGGEILPFTCTSCPTGQNIAIGKCKNNGKASVFIKNLH